MKIQKITPSMVTDVVKFSYEMGVFTFAHSTHTFDFEYVVNLWTHILGGRLGGGSAAYENTKLIGVIGWILSEGLYNTEQSVDVQLWSVSPGYRDTSVGGRLLHAALDEAKHRQLSLHVPCGPETPIEIQWSLHKMGFTPHYIEYEWREKHG